MQNQTYDDYGTGQDSVMPPRFPDKDDNMEIGVIRELSPKKVKEMIRAELKGFTFDYEQKKYVKVEGEVPMMNELGIQKFLNSFPAITDTVTFSNFTAEVADKIVLFIMESSIPSIYVNYKEYGIKDKSDLPVLTAKLFTLTHAAFHQAVGAGHRGVIGRTISESIMTRSGEMRMQQPMQNERRGIFSRINPFSR
jgi:hypothetical protein